MAEKTKNYDKLSFIASDMPQAQEALAELTKAYGNADPRGADAIIALGGDGLMLQALHEYMSDAIPIYGMNRGSIGFLMNEYAADDLRQRLMRAQISRLHPLSMVAMDQDGRRHEGLAINEVSLFRRTHQAAKIAITIDGKERMEELICDGILIATPAGSTAYNLSAHGPILPINAPLLALTPICPFRPRRWRGALIPNEAHIRFDVLESDKRAVNAVADHYEIENVVSVDVEQNSEIDLLMMFDSDHSLDERVIWEQFRY